MWAIILDARDMIFQWALYHEKEPRSFDGRWDKRLVYAMIGSKQCLVVCHCHIYEQKQRAIILLFH